MTLSDLRRHLPSQDAITQALAPRTQRSTAEYAGVLSLGLIAGAALALLLAPKARRQIRDQISDRVGGLRKRAKAKRLENGHAEERADSPT